MTVIDTLKALRDNADELADEAFKKEDLENYLYNEGLSMGLNKAINLLIFGANEHD